MKLLKQALAVLGTLVVVAVMVAVVTPKTVHAVAAALVQIVPGPATHVGQAEGQLVTLECANFSVFCRALDSSGNRASTDYTVPTGYTLVVTDWESVYTSGYPQGDYSCDFLTTSASANPLFQSCTLVNQTGSTYTKEHFTTGVRVASDLEITDGFASGTFTNGIAYVQGYLVPN